MIAENPVQPLEHMADMTHSRDRERVDATLLSAFLDLLPVERVEIWRVLGEPGACQEWLCCGGQDRHDVLAQTSARIWPSSPRVPLIAKPDHRACFESIQPRQIHAADGKVHALLPMAGEREVEGVVELVLTQPLDTVHLRMAQAVLRIHRNFLSLLDYSERDTLTGLLNRKSFDETFLKATVVEAERIYGDDNERRRHPPTQHWLAVLDIDHFKRVNDTYGHLIGDEVLVLVARLMRNTLRLEDRLYRFGGEEFVVLLSAPDDNAAFTILDRLRQLLETYPFPRVGRVTASIGFSDVRPGDTPQAAFERADKAVYFGKEHGRNQVCSYARLLASGHFTEAETTFSDIELF